MMVLGIETSTEVCSAGLADVDGRTFERSLVESHIHSEKLLILVQNVCREAALPLDGVDAVAISEGPGSFTGLRIGMSTAKGLCYALQKPVVAVSTLQAIAEGVFRKNPESKRVVVCVDARQGDFYVGFFGNHAGMAEPECEVTIRTLQDIAGQNVSGAVVVTDRWGEFQEAMGNKVECIELRAYCRGDSVARIGIRKIAGGKTSDLASLEPRYLKDFVVRSAQ